MVRANRSRSIFISIGFHCSLLAIIAAAMLGRAQKEKQVLRDITEQFPIELVEKKLGKLKKIKSVASQNSRPPIDLRPTFVKNGFVQSTSQAPSQIALPKALEGNQGELSEAQENGFSSPAYGKKVLYQSHKQSSAFHQLAYWVNHYLDYPELLVENGVQGNAILDLYFDDRGQVDENRSVVNGGHRLIRGHLVRAVRDGLKKWYRSDGSRLSPKEFANQHFQAEFELTSLWSDQAVFETSLPGQVYMKRRKNIPNCLTPDFGGTIVLADLTCVALRAKGEIQKNWSLAYKNQWEALRERLDYYDSQGLRGINRQLGG